MKYSANLENQQIDEVLTDFKMVINKSKIY